MGSFVGPHTSSTSSQWILPHGSVTLGSHLPPPFPLNTTLGSMRENGMREITCFTILIWCLSSMLNSLFSPSHVISYFTDDLPLFSLHMWNSCSTKVFHVHFILPLILEKSILNQGNPKLFLFTEIVEDHPSFCMINRMKKKEREREQSIKRGPKSMQNKMLLLYEKST